MARRQQSRVCPECGVDRCSLVFGRSRARFTARKRGERYSECDDCNWYLLVLSQMCKSYGISLDRYFAMLESQEGACYICHLPPGGSRRLAIDHDHACCAGRSSCGACVRGLLCAICNVWLGRVRDDPRSAAVRALHLLDYRSGHSTERLVELTKLYVGQLPTALEPDYGKA